MWEELAITLNIVTLLVMPMYMYSLSATLRSLDRVLPDSKPYGPLLQQLEQEIGAWGVQRTLESAYNKLIEAGKNCESDGSDSEPDSEPESEPEAEDE